MVETRKQEKKYSDAEFVDGVYKRDPVIERKLYSHCKQYFDENYPGVFFVGKEHKDEIFQDAFIKLWENIDNRKIYVENGILKGNNGEPFKCKLTTYFMSIAKFLFMEWARDNMRVVSDEEEEHNRNEQDKDMYKDLLYDSYEEAMIGIIADCISRMSERCNQIITMFYYEEKTLDVIMNELPSFESKDALKTAKYKCMDTLRKSAKTIYHKYLNS